MFCTQESRKAKGQCNFPNSSDTYGSAVFSCSINLDFKKTSRKYELGICCFQSGWEESFPFSELEFVVCVKDYGGKNFPEGVKTPQFICCRIAQVEGLFLYTYYILLMQFQLP